MVKTADNMLSPYEAAQKLKIPSKKILKLCESGQIPYFDFGGRVRISKRDLSRFIRESKVGRIQV